jgi:hypothetical protein
MWNKIVNWWLTLIKEEFELTVYFLGKIVEDDNGNKEITTDPQTYRCKAIKKLTQTHMIFIDLDGRKHEVKVVNPVGYELTKIY